jgi:hypothetical protein
MRELGITYTAEERRLIAERHGNTINVRVECEHGVDPIQDRAMCAMCFERLAPEEDWSS